VRVPIVGDQRVDAGLVGDHAARHRAGQHALDAGEVHAVGLAVEEGLHAAEDVHLVLIGGERLQLDIHRLELARLRRLPAAGIEAQAPEPGAENTPAAAWPSARAVPLVFRKQSRNGRPTEMAAPPIMPRSTRRRLTLHRDHF
jgi:hypothetical protein